MAPKAGTIPDRSPIIPLARRLGLERILVYGLIQTVAIYLNFVCGQAAVAEKSKKNMARS
jgi:hypothetical protein